MDVDEFLVMGGAQAIAALAYGTETIRPVDKIVGPGNAWVTAAKLEVLGEVAIDMPAGPSEVMVVADETADPRHVAADLLSQAEHGPDSPAILVTPSRGLADARRGGDRAPAPAAAAAGSSCAPRWARPASSSRRPTCDEALAFANDYAPEHLSVVVADDEAAYRAIRHAGSLFLGPLRARVGRRLRHRLQPRAADRATRPCLRRAGRRVVRRAGSRSSA